MGRRCSETMGNSCHGVLAIIRYAVDAVVAHQASSSSTRSSTQTFSRTLQALKKSKTLINWPNLVFNGCRNVVPDVVRLLYSTHCSEVVTSAVKMELKAVIQVELPLDQDVEACTYRFLKISPQRS